VVLTVPKPPGCGSRHPHSRLAGGNLHEERRQCQPYGNGVVLVRAVALAARRSERDTAPAMSHENVEIVRGLFEAFQRESGAQSVIAALDPAIVWQVRSDLPDAQTYTGHEGFRRLLGTFEEVLDESWYQPVQLLEAGDQVVVSLRWGGLGKASGVAGELEETWVFTLCDGKVTHVKEFATRSAALEAAGLRE
jgi:ketosteroid isomerase-like protein